MALDTQNAFQLLTFIAAPALLTNASTVLVLSTSNRFARAVDRARRLEEMPDTPAHELALQRVTRRALALNRALTSFYVAVASFAIGTFSELLGGGVAAIVRGEIAPIITMVGLFVATVGTFAIATGAAFLVAETWDAYSGLREEARDVLGRAIV
jgi:energy-converting hydrogenase Eha subunit E